MVLLVGDLRCLLLRVPHTGDWGGRKGFEVYARKGLGIRLRRSVHQDAYIVRRIVNGAYPPHGQNERVLAQYWFWDAMYRAWANLKGLASPVDVAVLVEWLPVDLAISDDVLRGQVVDLKKRLTRPADMHVAVPAGVTPHPLNLTAQPLGLSACRYFLFSLKYVPPQRP